MVNKKTESLVRITKEAFDEKYKNILINTEKELEELHTKYIGLLFFREQYRKDYKTNRIVHFLKNNNTITYIPGPVRNIGFNYKTKKK